ncbi:MAG: hypothetical protein ABL920_09095 [Methylotenera sp.]
MAPTWDLWIGEIFWLYIATVVISELVRKLRTSVKNKWITIAFCIFAYIACIAISVFHSSFSHQINQLAKDMSYEPSRPQLTKDWGDALSREDRTKYSQGIAQVSFVRYGNFRDYIDLNGHLREYEPTKIDRQYRANRLIEIKQIEYGGMYLFGMSIVWLLVPLLGVGIGFTSRQSRNYCLTWLRKGKQGSTHNP